MGELLVQLHQFGHTSAFAVELAPEPIRLHDGLIVGLMGFTQLRRHGYFIVEVCKAAIGLKSASVKNGLRRLLDFSLLRVGRCRPWEIVIDNIIGITVIALNAAAHCSNPCHMNIRDKYAIVI